MNGTIAEHGAERDGVVRERASQRGPFKKATTPQFAAGAECVEAASIAEPRSGVHVAQR